MTARNALGAGLATAMVVVALQAARQEAAQSQRTFRAGVDLVTVDVTVLDDAGVPVRGLDAGDFRVELNGVVRPVRVVDYVEFERLEAPIEITPNRPVAPPPSQTAEPRVVVLLLDDLSFVGRQDSKYIQVAGTQFLDSLRPSDLVGFATTSGEGALVNPSRDHAPVREALERSFGRFADRDPMEACPDSLQEGRCSCVSSMHDVIARGQLENYESVALSLGPAPVGRTMVIITRGIAPTVICGIPGTGSTPWLERERDLTDIQPFAQAVARAGVATYVLSPFPDAFAPSTSDKWYASAMLAADVAGARFEPVIGQAHRIYSRIRTAMAGFYRLGVELPPDADDLRLSVGVEVDRDDVRVEARRSVMVPDGARAAMTIDEALEVAAVNGEYWRDVPVSVAGAVRRGDDADALQLAIELAVPGLAAGPLDTVLVVVNEAGAVVWSGRSSLQAPGSTGEYRVATTVSVPAGVYRVRASAADAAGRIGVAERTVSARLHELDGVLGSDIFASWAGSTDHYRFFRDRLPADAEMVHAEIEIYPGTAALADELLVRWTLVSGDDSQPWVESQSEVRLEDGVLKGVTELPVVDLPAGLHTIRAVIDDQGTPLGVVSAPFIRLGPGRD